MGIRCAERRKVNVLKMKCLSSLVGVSRMDRVRNRKGVSEYSRSESIEMVFTCGKNERVLDGQKGVDGASKWRTGTRETEVRLDGWCEGSLGQHRNDSGGCASTRERSGSVESREPWYICY